MNCIIFYGDGRRDDGDGIGRRRSSGSSVSSSSDRWIILGGDLEGLFGGGFDLEDPSFLRNRSQSAEHLYLKIKD